MRQTAIALGVILAFSAVFSYFYLSGIERHSFQLEYGAAGEVLRFPEPSEQVYKAQVRIEGALACRTSIQITMNEEPYNPAISLGAGIVDGQVYNGDWYAGSALGLTLQPEEVPCAGNKLQVELVYYD